MNNDNPVGHHDIEAKITELAKLSHPELVEQWNDSYGAAPPKGLSRKLLTLAFAYKVQVQAYGDLDPKLGRRLQSNSVGACNASSPRVAARLRPGARLMREWNGRTHVVDVIEKGFRWNGETYASLSAIARAITGARWSGPRFFGLRGEGS